MNRCKPANIAHSVHQRLLAQAHKICRPFNELLQHYAIERFLYRLGRSPHAEKLLLKGVLLDQPTPQLNGLYPRGHHHWTRPTGGRKGTAEKSLVE